MKVRLDLKAGPMDIAIPEASEFGDKGGRNWPVNHPFGYLHRPSEKRQTEVYLNNIYDMAKSLPKGQDVVELFGGIGIFPRMLWPLLEPKSWTSVDLDPTLEPHFQEPRGNFVVGNAHTYKIPSTTGIVYMDVPTGTLQTIGRNMDGRQPMYLQLKDSGIPHVMLTDCGYYWCHLANHHPWYLATFGVKPTKDNYHTLYDKWMQDNIGYRMIDERHGGGCQLFHFVPL